MTVNSVVSKFFLKQVKENSEIYFDSIEMKVDWNGRNDDIWDLVRTVIKYVKTQFKKATFTATDDLKLRNCYYR